MIYDNKEIEALFRRLINTTGVLHTFLITNAQNIYTSDERVMRNDSVELQIFMAASRFLDGINRDADLIFKQGHWEFENRIFSLYEVNNNKLLIIHSHKQNWEEFDGLMLDVLLTL